MFRRLLIANRGEVAVRVARTARALGIGVVGVASEADLGASWLDAMDEVVPIGGSAPRSSYLRAERLLQAALQTRCSALHPGWGFLSENAGFAALCREHRVTFVGPPPEVIARMGQKWPAKLAMRAAGLLGIPGSEGLLEDADDAARAARTCGYPVILKADAGGGGRGMRLCRDEGELRAAFRQAASEAEAAFGSGRLYLERYLEGGRHIEVQVLCDAHGHAVHLGERDCSVQRNHQKLVEESPSTALDLDERAALGAAAARAAAAIGYVGAGTVEFLRAPDGELFFMEMNARLQVEHPVSELRYGVDLVEWQLRIAANQRLTLRQEELVPRGCAVECRINAEDPAQGFRPSPGKLTAFEFPAPPGPGRLRVDTHLAAGDVVPPHYDSLLAKLIAHGDTREAALETLLAALALARVEGVATTIPLHQAVLASEEFRAGRHDTSSIPGWSPAAQAPR